MEKKKQTRVIILKTIIQIFFLGLVLVLSFNHNIVDLGGQSFIDNPPSIHGVCPFGGVETAYTLITTGNFVKHLHESSVILFFALLASLLVIGAVFCGWICPLGAIQEWIGKLGKKIFKKRFNNWYSDKVHNILTYGRWVMLILIVVFTAISLDLIFTSFDPFYALFNFYTGEVLISAMIVLGLILVGSLFVERPWCKYLCPLGIINGMLSKISFFKIRRNKSTCIDCKKCSKECPEHIKVHEKITVYSSKCNRCMKCVEVCPVDNTLYMSSIKFSKDKTVKVSE